MKEAVKILESHDIKPTPNRILVVDRLLNASDAPLGLIELEREIRTMDRSSVLRVLSLLSKEGLVHIMEDGNGVSKYELCHCSDHTAVNDMHVHFFCEKCQRTYCLQDCPIPDISIPEGFDLKSANFMLKGICPDCQ